MTQPPVPEPRAVHLPDLGRLGGLDWTRRFSGRLTARERRRLLGAAARTQAVDFARRFLRTPGVAPPGLDPTELPTPPDSAFAKAAEAACDEQAVHLIGHGYRSWIYGVALAALDGVAPDPELFYVACLLHDHGLTEAVPGEEFTQRSAARAEICGQQSEVELDRITAVADAITVHLTPGITARRDGALGTYVQAGALLDLTSNRIGELPRNYLSKTRSAFPPAGFGPAIVLAIRDEANANPGTRLALLNRCGITHLVRR